MAALAGAVLARAAGPGPTVTARLTGCRRQQPLDGQRDLAVRCNVDDLHLHSITVVQHRVDILHIFIGHLGNVDHARFALRQRNKCAKGLYAGHTAFQYVPYLNCQNSILLALFLWGHRVCPQSCPAGCALSCRSHPQRCARWGLRSCKNPGRPTRSHRQHRR